MAFVAGSVSRPPPTASAAGAGAVRVNILSIAVKERGEPFGIADARKESFPISRIGAAYRALAGIEFIGARLSLVQGETRIMAGE